MEELTAEPLWADGIRGNWSEPSCWAWQIEAAAGAPRELEAGCAVRGVGSWEGRP